MDFGKLFNDNLLELDDLQMENSKNKINLIRRSNLQRNLARITFQKTIELYVHTCDFSLQFDYKLL